MTIPQDHPKDQFLVCHRSSLPSIRSRRETLPVSQCLPFKHSLPGVGLKPKTLSPRSRNLSWTRTWDGGVMSVHANKIPSLKEKKGALAPQLRGFCYLKRKNSTSIPHLRWIHRGCPRPLRQRHLCPRRPHAHPRCAGPPKRHRHGHWHHTHAPPLVRPGRAHQNWPRWHVWTRSIWYTLRYAKRQALWGKRSPGTPLRMESWWGWGPEVLPRPRSHEVEDHMHCAFHYCDLGWRVHNLQRTTVLYHNNRMVSERNRKLDWEGADDP